METKYIFRHVLESDLHGCFSKNDNCRISSEIYCKLGKVIVSDRDDLLGFIDRVRDRV